MGTNYSRVSWSRKACARRPSASSAAGGIAVAEPQTSRPAFGERVLLAWTSVPIRKRAAESVDQLSIVVPASWSLAPRRFPLPKSPPDRPLGDTPRIRISQLLHLAAAVCIPVAARGLPPQPPPVHSKYRRTPGSTIQSEAQ